MKIEKKVLNILKKGVLRAYKRNEVPVCAVILNNKGKVISIGINNRQKNYDVLGHAEVIAIRKAERKLKDWRLDGFSMIVTLEPCNMCSSIINECRLDKVYYFLSKNELNEQDSLQNILCLNGYEEEKKYFKNLLTGFFNNKR